MFKDASLFSGTGLSAWDVSSVTDMSSMFEGATSLGGTVDLSGWRTNKLGKTTSMFKGAASFSSDLPWDMSFVTDMSEMCK
jgi:surface protein